jgi:hypothetical protein
MSGTTMGRLGIGKENHRLETCTLKLINQTPPDLTKQVSKTKKWLPITMIKTQL